MRIISLCADGIQAAGTHGFFDWVEGQDADFICIQNLGCAESDLQSDRYFPSAYNAYFLDSADGKTNGVALYCRAMPRAIMTGLGFSEFDTEGRYIQADYDNISIASLLAPLGGTDSSDERSRKARFFGLLKSHLGKLRHKRRAFIICGGWNLVHTAADVQDPELHSADTGFLAEKPGWLDEVLELGYVDAFREINSDEDEFSWWPQGERGQNGLRTDFPLVSSELQPIIEYGAIYKTGVFSDHAPIIMDYDIVPRV